MNADTNQELNDSKKSIRVDRVHHATFIRLSKATGKKAYHLAEEALQLLFRKYKFSPEPTQPESK